RRRRHLARQRAHRHDLRHAGRRRAGLQRGVREVLPDRQAGPDHRDGGRAQLAGPPHRDHRHRVHPGVSAAGAMATPLAEHPDVRSAIDLFEAWVDAPRMHRELPGLALGAVPDPALVWARGFGWADVGRRVPATPDTLYRIGSITKLFTATAVLLLRDAGGLRLDDPVTAHLPWFRMAPSATDDGPITVRHPLTPTGGPPPAAAVPHWPRPPPPPPRPDPP